MIRVGLVGCGNVSYHHAWALRRSREMALVAAADPSPAKCEQFLGHSSVRAVYESAEAMMVAEDLELIIICTPSDRHLTVVKEILKTGRPIQGILCQKPMGGSLRDGSEIVRMCRERGILLQEGYMFRHHPRMARVQELVMAGAIGTVRYIRAALSAPLHDRTNWRARPDRAGGVVRDSLSYCLHALDWLFGGPPVRTAAIGLVEDGVDVAVCASLEYPGGLLVQAESSFLRPVEDQFCLYGDEGAILLDRPFISGIAPSVIRLVGKTDLPVFPAGLPDTPVEEIAFPAVNCYKEEILNLGEAIRGGSPVRVTETQSLATLQQMETILGQLRQGSVGLQEGLR